MKFIILLIFGTGFCVPVGRRPKRDLIGLNRLGNNIHATIQGQFRRRNIIDEEKFQVDRVTEKLVSILGSKHTLNRADRKLIKEIEKSRRKSRRPSNRMRFYRRHHQRKHG